MLKKFLTVLTVSFLLTRVLSAQVDNTKRASTAATFLEIGVGARAVGYGGAFVSVSNDASALYWNVGGIPQLSKNEISAIHTSWLADTKFNYAGLVIPLGDAGTLGFSFTSLSMDDMKVRTIELPEGTGEMFNAQDISIAVSYGRYLSDRFSIGFTVKYIQQTIWHMNASSVAFDIGTIFKTDLLGGMRIGAAMTNFGMPLQLSGRDTRYFIRVDDTKLGSNENIPVNIETDSWDLPLLFQIGISTEAFKTDTYQLTVALDALHPNNDKESINLGFEFGFKNALFIRGGYNALFLKDAEGGLSFGVGLNSNMVFSETVVQFDYGYKNFGRLKNIHAFGATIKF